MTNTLNTLLSNNNSIEYTIIIGCGIILSCTIYYIIRSNYTAIPSKNMEAITNQEIEAIVNENAVTNINNKNIDAIIDNDSDTDTDVDSQNTFDNESLSDSDTSSEFDHILDDPDLFFIPLSVAKTILNSGEFIMPDVDFNVCPIEELKLFEITSLFPKELAEKSITEEDLMTIISIFNKEELATNGINDAILWIIKWL
jgi:hypothetical protein